VIGYWLLVISYRLLGWRRFAPPFLVTRPATIFFPKNPSTNSPSTSNPSTFYQENPSTLYQKSFYQQSKNPSTFYLLSFYLLFQLLFPWRYVLYPGNIFWTEEGYRFAWRVMLMEKAGTATFYVRDARTGREGVVDNGEFLKDHYARQGVADPAVRAEVYVTLNARPSRLLIDPTVDLTRLRDGWKPKTWLLPDR
jgi:Vitamin K-dependent gamma-carboxylase